MFKKQNKQSSGVFVTVIGTPETRWVPKVEVNKTYCLIKEPNNPVDSEAIAVVDPRNNKKVGYVANSSSTVAKGTWSAGRLYDKMDDCTKVRIKFIMPDGNHSNGQSVGEVEEC